MTMPVIELVLISYFAYVFTSEMLHPFALVSGAVKRSRQAVGRAVGLSSLVAGLIAIYLLNKFSLDPLLALVLYLSMAAVFSFPFVWKHKKAVV